MLNGWDVSLFWLLLIILSFKAPHSPIPYFFFLVPNIPKGAGFGGEAGFGWGEPTTPPH